MRSRPDVRSWNVQKVYALIFDMWYGCFLTCVSGANGSITSVTDLSFAIVSWSLLFDVYSMRGKAQVHALLRYVVEEPPEGADNKRSYK